MVQNTDNVSNRKLIRDRNDYDDFDSSSGDVAVIGIGLRFPSGNLKESISKPNQLFNELLNGFDGIVSTCERWSDNYYLNGEIVSNLNGNSIEMKSIYKFLENNYNCKEIDYQEWIKLVSKSNGKSSKRYSTFHIHNNQNLMVSNFKINSLFKMSNSTKELLTSNGSYNHQDWEINESIILNNINNN
ncbi:hypothetical protein ACTFIR_002641 [Dictyostelium discoideum]